ncbi:MAG: PAS domain S-box protein [Myxococcales bacterium]|nr:PAS domain S-box protein [Myxococcales bacterium]
MKQDKTIASIDELITRLEENIRPGRSKTRGLDIASIRRSIDPLEAPVFLETLGGRVLSCNRAACEVYGYSYEEIIGLSVFDLIPIEVARIIPDLIVQQLHEQGMSVKAKGKHKDGRVFPTLVETRLINVDAEKRVLVMIRLLPEDEARTD